MSISFLDQLLKLIQNNTAMMMQRTKSFAENSKHMLDFYQDLAKFQKKYSQELLNDPRNIQDLQEYAIDYAQRQILFWDVLRKRGNQYIQHTEKGSPPVLIFDYEMVMDGRTMERPVNYALVSIRPPKGVTIDNNKRPFLIVDPRAGHGAGIGGFKDDSQVGVALRAGHPVYFVIFFPEPEPGQTLRDIAMAEKQFCEAIEVTHPNSPKVCIIGNCQGGWAVMALAAFAPDLAGGLVINGAPLSYWAGENGKNPMRYAGGLLGGSWPAQFASDLGNGKFDGANLVANFESLNLTNTYWEKYYHLFSNIDTEEDRFLEFERWWGRFYLMNAEEIRGIVENLFIGNYLSHGRIAMDRYNNLDLRKIRSPIIVFCSEGDNITPPQQALNWITDIYKNELEIKEAKQTIIYLVHRDIGHLGIFVSARVAMKEHSEIVDLLDYIEFLPSGLYEMIIHENPDSKNEDDRYKIVLEERTIDDIIDRSPEAHKEDKNIFRAVRKVSKYNAMFYDLFASNFVRAFSTETSAKILRQMHPLRRNRYMISDNNPIFKPLAHVAEVVRKERRVAQKDNPYLTMQKDFSDLMVKMFNNFQETRDDNAELTFHQIYKQLAILWAESLKSEEKPYAVKTEEQQGKLEVDKQMFEGEPLDAVIRVLFLIISAQKFVQGSRVADVRNLLRESGVLDNLTADELRQRIHTQSLLIAKNSEQALQTLPQLMHSKAEHEFVVKTLRDILKSVPFASPKAEEMWARIVHVLE
jgi:pimeloyl-ACP methyl ester carboxylesterase